MLPLCRPKSFNEATGLVGRALVACTVFAVMAPSVPRAAEVPPLSSAQSGKVVAEPPASRAAPELDSASRNTAARARMLECGHQWSNMKKAGTASGTWKEFSRGCLAQK